MPARGHRAAGDTGPTTGSTSGGTHRLVAVVGLRRATAFVLLGGLTTALDGPAAAVLAQLGAIAFATCSGIGCLRAARRTTGVVRRGWTALAVAAWTWGVARLVALVWTEDADFPSPADVAGLAFPIVALVAVCLLAPPSAERPLPRRVLDALTVGCALCVTAWVLVVDGSAFGPTGSQTGSLGSTLIWMASPVGDAVLLTVMVLTVAQDRRLPWRWALLGAAMLAMAVSDGLTAVLLATGDPALPTVAHWGWWAAFCLLTTAGAAARPVDGAEPAQRAALRHGRPGLLPYLPLAVAAVVVGVEYGRGRQLDDVTTVLTGLLVCLVLARQYCTLRDNHRLARAVADREGELHHLAFHDALTGLANRALFLDRLRHALDLATREPRAVSVVFVDLDGFKTVNDTLGHAAGDQLLVGVAKRMRGAIRATDTVARLGGDEFAVLVEQGADATVVARTLLASLRRPFVLDDREVAVSASIGVATADPGLGADGAGGLMHRADVAMYAVKTSGKSGVLAHSPGLPIPTRTPPPPAEQAGRVFFRPVVDAGHGRIVALEVVPCWSGSPGPDHPIVPLAGSLLDQACRQLALWSAGLGHHRLRIRITVAVAELDDLTLPARLDRVLARHRLAPGQLTLELDDGALPHRSAVTLDVLHRLHHLGVRLGLGGLGSGYATLAWLAGAPLDSVRIDGVLVADIDHDLARCRLLHGVLALTRQLGLRSVADGVERTGQLVQLRRLGCDQVAGHLVAGPATAAELTPVVLGEQPLLPRGLLRQVGGGPFQDHIGPVREPAVGFW